MVDSDFVHKSMVRVEEWLGSYERTTSHLVALAAVLFRNSLEGRFDVHAASCPVWLPASVASHSSAHKIIMRLIFG